MLLMLSAAEAPMNSVPSALCVSNQPEQCLRTAAARLAAAAVVAAAETAETAEAPEAAEAAEVFPCPGLCPFPFT